MLGGGVFPRAPDPWGSKPSPGVSRLLTPRRPILPDLSGRVKVEERDERWWKPNHRLRVVVIQQRRAIEADLRSFGSWVKEEEEEERKVDRSGTPHHAGWKPNHRQLGVVEIPQRRMIVADLCSYGGWVKEEEAEMDDAKEDRSGNPIPEEWKGNRRRCRGRTLCPQARSCHRVPSHLDVCGIGIGQRHGRRGEERRRTFELKPGMEIGRAHV